MSERWRDHKGEPGFVFQPWMRTVDDLEDQIAELVAVLKLARDHFSGHALAQIDAALAKAAEAQS